jgi:NAD-dependent SIR2 family protein deacetylase
VPGPPVEIPEPLVEAVESRRAVLFAGAGISLPAGLPSAAVFSEHLAQTLYGKDPDYAVSPVGSAFSAIASDLEALTSRAFLLQEVEKILKPPQGLHPTIGHTKAVTLFDLILTTNWDDLFEEAAAAQHENLTLVADEIVDRLPERAIIKLHGSFSTPSTLLLAEREVLNMDRSRSRLWKAICEILHNRPVVVVGTSLRDPSIIRLFEDARPSAPGYFVVPRFFEATQRRLRAWNLECIAADADTFLTALADAAAMRGGRPSG